MSVFAALRVFTILVAAVLGAASAQANQVRTEFVIPGQSSMNPVSSYVTPGLPLTWALYGTTQTEQGESCSNVCGIVYKLTPPRTAGSTLWTETVLHTFTGPSGFPINSPLAFDRNGAAYGVIGGGSNGMNGDFYPGTVYKLTPPAAGDTTWKYSKLYTFQIIDNYATSEPAGGLVVDASGALYGVSSSATPTSGIVFKLTPPATPSGAWTYSVVHSFASTLDFPTQGLVMDSHGKLYGTTNSEVEGVVGVVYRLTPPAVAGGAWTYDALYTLKAVPPPPGPGQGSFSVPLVLGPSGVLYGATNDAGSHLPGNDSVFRLNPPAAGQTAWTKTTLYGFPFPNSTGPGTYPIGLVSCGDDLCGSTQDNSGATGGMVFQLTPPASGQGAWTKATLATFPRSRFVVGGPFAVDSSGNLYGTLIDGTVFKVFRQVQ